MKAALNDMENFFPDRMLKIKTFNPPKYLMESPGFATKSEISIYSSYGDNIKALNF